MDADPPGVELTEVTQKLRSFYVSKPRKVKISARTAAESAQAYINTAASAKPSRTYSNIVIHDHEISRQSNML